MSLSDYSIDDLKQVYRALHAHLMEHPELMDSELFHQMQKTLQSRAQKDGVDLADHAAWDAWLRKA